MNNQQHICKCGETMLHREAKTPEQQWCGTWFLCPACGRHLLIESEELKAQNAKFFDQTLADFKAITRKKEREKFLKNHDMHRKHLESGINPFRTTESA